MQLNALKVRKYIQLLRNTILKRCRSRRIMYPKSCDPQIPLLLAKITKTIVETGTGDLQQHDVLLENRRCIISSLFAEVELGRR